MGPYSDVKQLNLARMTGVSYFSTTPSPGTSWREFKELKDRRKHDPLSSTASSLSSTAPHRSQKCGRDGDLRNKLNRRSCPENSRSLADHKSTHRGARHRNATSSSGTENFLEFTKIPSKSDKIAKKSSSKVQYSSSASNSLSQYTIYIIHSIYLNH